MKIYENFIFNGGDEYMDTFLILGTDLVVTAFSYYRMNITEFHHEDLTDSSAVYKLRAAKGNGVAFFKYYENIGKIPSCLELEKFNNKTYSPTDEELYDVKKAMISAAPNNPEIFL